MRITFISELSLPQSPTLGRELSDITTALRRQGHRPTLILPAHSNWHIHHPHVQYIPALPMPGTHGLTLTFPQATSLKQQLAAGDIIHIFQPFNLGRWATRVAHTQKKPLIFSWRTDEQGRQTPNGVLRGQAEEPYLRQARAASLVIADSESQAAVLRKKLDLPVVTLLPPIASTSFPTTHRGALRKQLGLHPAAKIIVTAVPAHTAELQFLDGILERLPPDTELALLGSASQLRRIQHARRTLRHAQHIHLIQAEYAYQVAEFLFDADVALFLSPQTNEQTISQALAAALPIVAAHNTPAANTVTETGAGFLVKHTYTDAAEKLCHLLLRPAQHHLLAQRARSAAALRSVEHTAMQLTNIYRLAKQLRVHS